MARRTSEDSKLLGAKMLININASPFHINKSKERQDLLVRRCLEEIFLLSM